MGKNFFASIGLIKDEPIETTQAETNKKDVSVPVTNQPSTTSNLSVQGVQDDKFIDMLETVIEQASTTEKQGYFTFKKAIENMKSLNMDEKTKFQTVFSVLSLQGCKKDILLSTSDKYIKLIEEEKSKFDLELKNHFAQTVQSKLDLAEQAKKEVETLTKRLSDLNTQIITLSQEAQTEELKIKATEANFKASAEAIISQMNADKEKITNYLV